MIPYPCSLALTLLISLSLTGCSAEAKKGRLVKRADAYAAAGEYEKAKIEYLNALRADPNDGEVYQKMGQIWLDQGSPLEAFKYLGKASELKPKDLALRAKKAETLLGLGQVAAVRKDALAILDADPKNGEGIKLLADASRTPEELTEAEQRLQAFPARESVAFHLASATIAMRKRDFPGAETSVKAAMAADAKSATPHSLMAVLHLVQEKKEEAMQEIKAAAELSPARSAERVNYASVTAQTGNLAEARRILNEITKEAPDYVPALRAQAQIAFSEKKYDEGLKLIDKALATDPENFEARLLQAEIWLTTGETKKAVELLERVAEKYPAPIAKYQLARAHLQDKDVDRATVVLSQAIAANHDFTEAILLLAQLDLRSGDAPAVATAMEDLLRKRPALPQAQLLLVDAYRALNRFEEAAAIIREQIKAAPDSAQPHLLLGVILRQQKKDAEARKSFEKALELAPGTMAAVNQLIELDVQENNFTAATEKIEGLLKQAPEAAAGHFLQGKVHLAQQRFDEAEASLKKTLELDPNFSGAYDLLISIYVNTKKLPQALEQLGNVLAKDPKNVGALMMTGMIHAEEGDFLKARDNYEKLLAVAPDSPVAQNNLAYLYSERLDDLEKAYPLAQKARAARGDDPSVADTLGWILYKRGDYQQAQVLLQESAGKLSDNAEVQYHLGMASYMMGEPEAARAALAKAAAGAGKFPGKEEARSRLALLGDPSATAADVSIPDLEALLKQHPNDILARLHLAEAHEKAGDPAKAAAAYEAAIKVNPKLHEPYIKLAQLHAGPLNDKAKAFDLAKNARELAPNDPKTAGLLGGIGVQTGNVTWAYNLLQESAGQLPDDPIILSNLAWAAYGLGNIPEAQKTMQKALQANPDSPEASEAKTFLRMVVLEQSPRELAAASLEIEGVLKQTPEHTPALMARAALQALQKDEAGAVATYTLVNKHLPEFGPAMTRLAALYLRPPQQLEKAQQLTLRARRLLPDDAELAQLLGEIRFHKGEFAAARQLFQECAERSPLGAEALYFLGASCKELQDLPSARTFLKQALGAGLPEPYESTAKRLLNDLGG